MRRSSIVGPIARAVSLACVFIFALSLRFGDASAAEKIRLGMITLSVTNWPIFVAEEKGLFRQEGLDVEIAMTGSSAKSLQLVAADAIDIGNSSLTDSIRVIDGGGGMKVIANSFAVGAHSLLAAKDIKSVKDLKGKRVIVGGVKDITAVWWAAMARAHGLDPLKDVQLLYSGSTGNRFAALSSGGVEGSILSPPISFKAVSEGFTDLGPVATYARDLPFLVFHADAKWADAHKSAVVKFIRVNNKAIAWVYDPANRADAIRLLSEKTKTSEADSAATYDLLMKIQSFDRNSAIRESGVREAIEVLDSYGDLKRPLKPVSAFYDPSYVNAAR
ncbi:MAG: ABC transporter substrate-binding protein [Proteobacteria bacterium]|nr:ABC transporter substrate-binding protein [Pseudomonadota bacterium]